MSIVNKDLLKKVMDKIDSLPDVHTGDYKLVTDGVELWNQGVWAEPVYNIAAVRCGTAACFAGWTAILNGATLYGRDQVITGRSIQSVEAISSYSREALGLSVDQSDELFAPYNSREDLHRIVSELLATED